MAYFLPNGITDDSPPKRSAMMSGSFGPIGGRFGGDASTAAPSTSMASDLTAFGAFGGILGGQTASTSAPSSAPSSSFLLHELGGEIHEPIWQATVKLVDQMNLKGAGLRDEEDELSCHSVSMHHSIADYSYQAAPPAQSIQKTKRLDRRALAYVRGRKFR
ncbi:hypothetical protein P43SY_007185 [Pythium insidiosum]|uniref:Uncharacterized protein n=1 Tax=Pythium insidiosum TaxID=114742 RepID=A0AAD5M0R7_PYTIN|nr:hypothetical protein P43SY_007185 [Pythium insidiosum]